MTWRPYAAGVAISAGVFVTGVLWWERANPHIAGEDMAAYMADGVERIGVMYGTARYPISIITNVVGPARRWDEEPPPHWDEGTTDYYVYVTTGPVGVWELLRNQFGFVYYRSSGGSHGRVPRWLDGEWSDAGTVLTYNYPPWYVERVSANLLFSYEDITYHYHSVSSPASATPTYVTLDTRLPPAGTDLCYPYFNNRHIFTNLPAASDYAGCPLNADDVAITTGYDPYPGSGNWWTYNGHGSNVYCLPEEIPYSPTNDFSFRLRSQALQTNVFNRIRSIVGKMNSAIQVGGFTVSSSVWSSAEAPCFSREISLDKSDSALSMYSAVRKRSVAGAWSNAVAAKTMYVGEAVPAHGSVSYDGYWRSQDAQTRYPLVPTTITGDVRYAEAYTSYEGCKHYDVQCPWPPTWAYETGLVARVRYYAIWRARVPDNFGYEILGPYNNDVDYPYDSFSSTAITPNTYQYRAFPDGVSRIVSPNPASGALATVQSSGYNYYFLDPIIPNGPQSWRLDKIADVLNPSAAPLVDIGVDVEDINVSFSAAQSAAWYFSGSGGTAEYRYWTHSEERHRFMHHHTLYLVGLICVADFNFTDYMDGGKGEPYTPPWATNAPPLTP